MRIAFWGYVAATWADTYNPLFLSLFLSISVHLSHFSLACSSTTPISLGACLVLCFTVFIMWSLLLLALTRRALVFYYFLSYLLGLSLVSLSLSVTSVAPSPH